MSKEEYVQLEAVREALEKVIKSETEIEKVLELLSEATVQVDEAKQVEPPAAAPAPTGEEDGEDLGTPKQKMQYVMLVSDPKGVINCDLTGWVLKYPEEEDCREIVAAIKKGAYNFNASKKGRKYPVSSIGQAIDGVPGKFYKPYRVKVVTKEAVYIVTTNNELPKE